MSGFEIGKTQGTDNIRVLQQSQGDRGFQASTDIEGGLLKESNIYDINDKNHNYVSTLGTMDLGTTNVFDANDQIAYQMNNKKEGQVINNSAFMA